ncbi:hypothetical protein, partial [Curtobacterium aurantiacum]
MNNIAKTAVVSGMATPGAKVWIGEQSADVNASGAWSMTVSVLEPGKNDLVVIQKIDNEEFDRKTVSATIVEGGGLFAVDQGPVELERGATTQVPFVVENRVSRTDTKGTVVLTAPDGATFSEQDTVQGSWRRVGNTAWNASTSIPLTNGRLSNDNTTLTFDVDWASERPTDQQYRFMVDVTASDEAPEEPSAMDFVFSGTSSTNDFRAEGTTTTTIETAVVDLVARITSIDHAAKTAVISGTATPGAKVTIGEKSVDADAETGAWSITVEDLVSGKNTLHVVQEIDDEEHDSKDVDVTVNDAAITGQDGTAVTLERDQVTSVESLFKTNGSISNPSGTVEFTAPEGTTFRDGQNTIMGGAKKPGGEWDNTYLRLTDGKRSEDGTKYTYTFRTASYFREPADTLFKWNIDVVTPADAEAETSPMTTKLVGTATEGAFNTTSSTATTIEAPSVAAPTGTVTFSDDVTQKATVSGTGVDGATITLYAGDSTTAIGTAVVNNGTWSTTIDPIGAGDQKIRIEQSGIDGIQTAETTAAYGAAVTLEQPDSSTVVPGAVTVTGAGQAGTTVTITGGAKPVTTTVESDGTFSTEVELEPSNTAKTLTAQQHSKGNLTTSDTITVTPNGAQTARDVVITEPTSHTYQPNRATTISGTATPYATVQLRFQWNDTVHGTAKADINGNWSITRGFGPAAKYELTATQTRFDKTTSTSAMFNLDPEGISNKEVVITGPADHAYKPGEPTRVTGTATPFATIELRFQWNDTVYGTAVANANGEWNILRAYGPAATYELTAKQLRADGTTSLSNTFTLEATGIDRPFTLTTPAMDSTFEPGAPVSFTGTGTRGATITAIAPAWNNNVIFTTKVDDNGKWELRRGFAPGITYDLTLVQQPLEGDPTSITGLHLTP